MTVEQFPETGRMLTLGKEATGNRSWDSTKGGGGQHWGEADHGTYRMPRLGSTFSDEHSLLLSEALMCLDKGRIPGSSVSQPMAILTIEQSVALERAGTRCLAFPPTTLWHLVTPQATF